MFSFGPLTAFRWFFAFWSVGFFRLSFGGDSSSSTTTYNIDKRIANGEGVAVSADNSAVNVTTSDPAIVSRALATVDVNNATNAAGFSQLLDAAESLFDRGEKLIGQTQAAVADAYGQAQANTSQTIDNRTLIALAAAGAAALYAITRRK